MANCPNCKATLPENAQTCPHCAADASWWLAREGEVFGPYDLATVRFILADDRATLEDLAMIGREGQWQVLGELIGEEGLAVTGPTIPPVASTAADEPKGEPARYRNWSVTGWLVYVVVFVLICAGAAGAIIWPMYAGVSRENAAEQAESNLRQIGLALQLYVHECGGRLPLEGKWEEAIACYLPDPQLYRTRIRGEEEAYWYNDALAGGDPAQWSNQAKLVVAAEPGAFDEPQASPPRAEGFFYLHADGEVTAHPPGETSGELKPSTAVSPPQ